MQYWQNGRLLVCVPAAVRDKGVPTEMFKKSMYLFLYITADLFSCHYQYHYKYYHDYKISFIIIINVMVIAIITIETDIVLFIILISLFIYHHSFTFFSNATK